MNPQTRLVRYAAIGIAAALWVPTAVAQQTYDLAQDWSDLSNPFGAWSLYKSRTERFSSNVPNYWGPASTQRAWADDVWGEMTHVPAWVKNSVENSSALHPGDVWMHSAELDRTGSDWTSVAFKVPHAGTAVISGDLWSAQLHNRRVQWSIQVNRIEVTKGEITSCWIVPCHDACCRLPDCVPATRATPVNLANGTGGSAALIQNVRRDDTIELVFVSLSESGNLGDQVALRFRVQMFPSQCRADFNSSGTVTVQDLFDFLAAWFAGCP